MDHRSQTAHARSDWESHDCRHANPDPGNLRKQRLTDVRHITHLADARRILADGRIKASLVRDDSRLGRSRLPVSWLSANQWSHGSIYGHVEFVFDWRTITAGRKLYWVETIPYDTPTYRILVTDRQAPRRLVVRYKPRVHRGPLIRRGETWFWNGDHRVSQFMLQDDLPLEQCKAINFIEHRHDRCKDHRSNCPDAALHPMLASFFTISYVLASSTHSADAFLRREHGWLSPLDQFVHEFPPHLSLETRFRSPPGKPRDAKSLMRAILALWSCRDSRSAVALARRFSKKAFRKTLIAIVRNHIGDPHYRPKHARHFLS